MRPRLSLPFFLLLSAVALTACSGESTSTPAADAALDAADTEVAIDAPEDSGPPKLPFVPSNGVGEVSFDNTGDLVFEGEHCGNTVNQTKGRTLCDPPDNGVYRSFELTQSDGSKIMVFVARNIRIAAGTSIKVAGPTAVALVALEELVIDGELIAAANFNAPGPGGFVTESDGTGKGPSAGGYSLDQKGGGAGGCGAGGASGGGATGGTANTTSTLSPLAGGSSGGGPIAGAGGGALQLVAGREIRLGSAAVLHVGGGGGNSGAGGGAGGNVLFEAPQITVAGVLAANGGGGGAGTGGARGENAKPSATAASGGASTAATPVVGGAGSGGGDLDGKPGAAHPTSNLHGGGGAASGLLRFHTSSGTATITGTLSPSNGSACVTFGTLSR